jgi:hypothetical protein
MDNALGTVALERVDPSVADRVEGRVVELDRGRPLRARLALVDPLGLAGPLEPAVASEGGVRVQ